MKTIKLFAVLCCAVVCIFTFSSCKKDANDPQTPEQSEQKTTVKPVAARMDYTLNVTDQMREVADINVSFYDKDGQLQTEQLTSNTWNKVMEAALPAKLGVQVKLALKADFDSTRYDVFTALRNYHYEAYCIDADGKKCDAGETGDINTPVPMASDKIEAFITKYSTKPLIQTLYTIDAEGNFTYHSEWE